MNQRTHRYLDGELRREELTPDELQEIAKCEHLISETRNIHRSIKVPDLTGQIMARLPAEGPASRSNHHVVSKVVRHSVGWLWTPRPISLRPVYGILTLAGLLLMIVLPAINARLRPSITNISVSNVDGEHRATKVFVQFRLDAPQASVVRLAGSFTGWKPTYTLQQVTSGVWSILIPLEPGVHDYAFIVNGAEWVPDPAAPTIDDGFGGVNSRLSVLLPNGDLRL
jgi:hypothetical protein